MMRHVAVIMPLLLAGCIHAPVDEVGPSFETVKLIRAAGFAPVALGTFSTSPSQSRLAKRINIRGSSMGPPKGGDFPSFLKQTLQTELVTAGSFDPASATKIWANMTKNSAGENMSKGVAVIAATFTVTKQNETVFSRNYEVENRWKSEFIGAIAIPEAFQQYNALYGQLVRRALSDPEFVAALAH
jgi:hypothetical protein